AGRGDAPARPVELRAGQRHPGHLRAEFAAGELGQRPPAAADLKDAVAGADAALRESPARLRTLRLDEVPRSVAVEPGAAVAHRRVEPLPVEVVAEVVMGVDVLLRAASRVAPQQVTRAVEERAPPRAVEHRLDLVAIGGEDLEQAGK